MALRRQVKNVVRNFSDIEVKVRESTSNDPWGPSSSLTSEIADATYNVQAFSEIMVMLWKRINDHGKNWRHVYKSLVVLDYIVKTGSERVAQQCRENIFAIKTLKDFQFIDKDGKDQGINVREKSKALVALLKDDERLKAERERALKAKERFTQSQGGIGNTSYPGNKKSTISKYSGSKGSMDDSNIPSQSWQPSKNQEDSRSTDGRITSELEKVRPSNELEEEMQLQIALAMSKEEAERERKSEDAAFQIAVNNSTAAASSTLLNLTDSVYNPQSKPESDPWGCSHPQSTPSVHQDPWGKSNTQTFFEPSNVTSVPLVDPWSTSTKNPVDPWAAPSSYLPSQQPDLWSGQDSLMTQSPFKAQSYSPPPLYEPFQNDVSKSNVYNQTLAATKNNQSGSNASHTFLKNGAHLVDVDNIIKPANNQSFHNPFMSNVPASNTNPFLQDKPKPKSINELRNNKSFAVPGPGGDTLLPAPLQPTNNSGNNPFLL
ncbi:epsin-2 [Hydra vulgaris]|uniref:Epsin-2 n=1 Tax=Hydra vulgaris TaxID=6087 RepID=T2MHC8_HYDVU|nr:epsin-2 [Hydra vulgaris]